MVGRLLACVHLFDAVSVVRPFIQDYNYIAVHHEIQLNQFLPITDGRFQQNPGEWPGKVFRIRLQIYIECKFD